MKPTSNKDTIRTALIFAMVFSAWQFVVYIIKLAISITLQVSGG